MTYTFEITVNLYWLGFMISVLAAFLLGGFLVVWATRRVNPFR